MPMIDAPKHKKDRILNRIVDMLENEAKRRVNPRVRKYTEQEQFDENYQNLEDQFIEGLHRYVLNGRMHEHTHDWG